MQNERDPANPTGRLEFARPPVEEDITFHDDEQTANLLRRAAERQQAAEEMPEARRITISDDETNWRDTLSTIATSLQTSLASRALIKGVGGAIGATADWIFAFSRWFTQVSERRTVPVRKIEATAGKVAAFVERLRRRTSARVEVIRFVRNAETLNYSFERTWTHLHEVPGCSQSYGMATIVLGRFGWAHVVIRGVNLQERGLRIRLARRKGLTLFRLQDGTTNHILLQGAAAVMLLSQYHGEEPVQLARLIDALQAHNDNVYKPSPELITRLQAEWGALKAKGILKSSPADR